MIKKLPPIIFLFLLLIIFSSIAIAAIPTASNQWFVTSNVLEDSIGTNTLNQNSNTYKVVSEYVDFFGEDVYVGKWGANGTNSGSTNTASAVNGNYPYLYGAGVGIPASFTVSGWVKISGDGPSNGKPYGPLVYERNTGHGQIQVYYYGAEYSTVKNTVQTLIGSDLDARANMTNTNQTTGVGDWVHWAFVRNNSGSLTGYINGVKDPYQTDTGSPGTNSGTYLKFGGSRTGNLVLNGSQHDVRWWGTTALSDEQIFSLYVESVNPIIEEPVYSSENATCDYNVAGDWNYTWYVNDEEVFSDSEGIYCYQESSNISNQSGTDGSCELNYTGNYSFDTYANDGDWSTGTSINSETTLYINYTIPTNMATAVTQFKYRINDNIVWDSITTNETIPSTCLENSVLNFKYDYVDIDKNNKRLLVYCLNSSDLYSELFSFTMRLYPSLSEEAMYWYTNESFNNGTLPFSYFDVGNNLTCEVNDDNSSSTTILSTPPVVDTAQINNTPLTSNESIIPFCNGTDYDSDSLTFSYDWFVDGSLSHIDGGVSYWALNTNDNVNDSWGSNDGTFNINAAAYYPFNGNADDESVNSNDGVVTGATLTTDHLGNANNAYAFNGVSDYVRVSNNSSLQITGSQTISMWLYSTDVASGRQNPLNKAYGGEGTITQEMDGALNYYYGTSGNNTNPYQGFGTPGGCIIDDEWIFITIVRDLTAMTLSWYKNGQFVDSTTAQFAAATASTADVIIGNGYAGQYTGKIDDVLILDTALTADEVENLYNISSVHKLDEPLVTKTDSEGNSITGYEFTGSYMGAGGNGINLLSVELPDLNINSETTVSYYAKFMTHMSGTQQAIIGGRIADRNSIYIGPNNKLYFRQDDSSLYSNIILEENKIYQMVSTYEYDAVTPADSLWSMYITDANGTILDTNTRTGYDGFISRPQWIGGESRSGSQFFGVISEPKIFNKSLTAAEISNLFTYGNAYSFFNKDEEVILQCVANDGTSDSIPVNSSSTTILNTPPIVDTVEINDTPIMTNETLIPYCNGSDYDNDSLTFSYDWYVNDEVVINLWNFNKTVEGNISYYSLDGNVDDSWGTNDGTLSTATVISSMDSLTGWSSTSATEVSLNNNIYQEGTGAINIYNINSGNNLSMYKDISSTDFTGKKLSMYVYIKNQKVLDGLYTRDNLGIFYLISTSDFFRFDLGRMEIGWNVVNFDCDNPASESGTPDITAITGIKFSIEGQQEGARIVNEGDIIFDYIQYGAPMKTLGPDDKENTAYSFNGEDNKIVLPVTLGDVSSTFSLWVKPKERLGRFAGRIYGSGAASRSGSFGGTADIFSYTVCTPDANFVVYDDAIYVLNTWYYVTGVVNKDTSTVKLYVDGELKDTKAYTGALYTDIADTGLGWSMDSGNNYYELDMADVKLYDRALSDDEVSNLYVFGSEKNFLSPEDEVILQCIANDATNDSPAINSSSTTILNTPPVVDAVQFNNTPVISNESIVGYCEASDFDYNTLTYNYDWYVNSVSLGINNVNLDYSNYNKDDTVILQCVANDGTSDSIPVNSSSTTILNTPPVVDTVEMTNVPVLSNESITGFCNATDYDSDALTYSYDWFLNAVSLGIDNINLDAINFNKDDEVILQCTANDGADDSAAVNSSSTTILSTPPVVDTVEMTNIPVTSNESIIGFCNGTDYDSDALTYSYDWYVNDNLVVTNSFEGLCYQESATESNQTGIDGSCDLDYDGFYAWDEQLVNPENGNDGDWDTYSTLSVDAAAYSYINYTIPEFANLLQSKIQTKISNLGGTVFTNISLSSCENSGVLQLQITQIKSEWGIHSGILRCWDGTGWNHLVSTQLYGFYEEGVYWHINTSEFSETLSENYFDKDDTVILQCIANDGTSDSTPVNSSSTTILSTPPVVDSVTVIGTYADNDVAGYCNVSDYDGDTVDTTFAWYVNDILKTTGNSGFISEGQYIVPELSSSYLSVGDLVTLKCNSTDGIAYGNNLNNSITLINHGINFTYMYTDDTTTSPQIGEVISFQVISSEYDFTNTCHIDLIPEPNGTIFDTLSAFIFASPEITNRTISTSFVITNDYTAANSNVSWKMFCTDNSGNSGYSDTEYFIVKDSTSPVINITNTTLMTNGTIIENVLNDSYLFELQFADNNLFQSSINITCENYGEVFYWEILDINTTTYNFSQLINFSGVGVEECDIVIQSSDAHTATEIPKYDYEIVGNTITYNTENGLIVNITSSDDLTNIKTKKLVDRYNFEFTYEEQKLIRRYEIESDGILFNKKDSKYPGHFVVWNEETHKGNWIDFALPNLQDYIYITNKISANKYEIILVHKILVNPESTNTYETNDDGSIISSVIEFFTTPTVLEEPEKGVKTEKQLTEGKPLTSEEVVNITKIKVVDTKQLSDLENLYGTKSLEFNSIGGTNVQEVSSYFFMGGDFNVTSYNIVEDVAFNNYTLDITKAGDEMYSYSETVVGTQTYVINQSEDTYTFTMTHPHFITKSYTTVMETQSDVCEQDNANETVSCASAVAGEYVFSDVGGIYNVELMFDNSTTTYAEITSLSDIYIYANYTVPTDATFALWDVTAFGESGTVEIPIDTENKTMLQFRMKVKNGNGNDNIELQEYTNSNWSILDYTPLQIYDSEIFDEKITWYEQQDNMIDVIYNTSETLITFNMYNVKSRELIPEYTLFVNDTSTGIVTEYNVVNGDSGFEIPLNAGTYNITFSQDQYINISETYIFDYKDVETVTAYIPYTASIEIYDEDTLELFDFGVPIESEILIVCDGETKTYPLSTYDNVTNITTVVTEIPIECEYKLFKFAITYADGINYYRKLIVPYEDSYNITAYLLDLTSTSFVYSALIIDDLMGRYENTSIWVKKQIENETVIIMSDYTDIEDKIGAYLIENDDYIIEVHSSNNPVKIIGFYSADIGENKVISLYDINLESTAEGFYQNVRTSIQAVNDSGIPTVLFLYEDLENNTESLQLEIREDSYYGALIYQSPVYYDTNYLDVQVAMDGYQNTTMVPTIVITHSVVGQKNVSSVVNKNWRLNLGIEEYVEQETMNWIFMIFLSALALMSSVSISYAGLVVAGFAVLFAMFGWMIISLPTLALAVVISLLDFFMRGKKQ